MDNTRWHMPPCISLVGLHLLYALKKIADRTKTNNELNELLKAVHNKSWRRTCSGGPFIAIGTALQPCKNNGWNPWQNTIANIPFQLHLTVSWPKFPAEI